MRKIRLVGILVCSVCAAQDQAPTPAEINALTAALITGFRGIEDTKPDPVSPPALTRLVGGAVSVAQLRHKPKKNVQKSVTRGARFSAAGDHRRAAEEFERAATADPEFANAYDRLGVEYAQLGRYTEAKAELQRSLTLDPTSWTSHYDLGVILSQTGDLPGAERSVRRALEFSSANVQAHTLLGLLLWHQVETRAEALEHLRYAARTSPKAKELLASLGGY
jgi:tetratricopeptide (TPR) repeat protein